MRVPSSTPAGMLTESVRSRVTRPAPLQVGHGVGDHLAAALAGRAGALDGEEALRRAHLADAAAGRGRSWGCVPALAPEPVQVSQVTVVGTLICAVLPSIGLVEGDLHVVAEIGAALARRALPRRAAGP